jgi:spermidine synthase
MPLVETPELATHRAAGRGSALPLLLYAMTGFTGLLAEQGLEKYTTLLVGATTAASAAVIFTYFLGFALGGFLAARLLRGRAIPNPLRAYALLELLVGIGCAGFSYVFHPLMEVLAPLQNLADGQVGKLAVRFACACLLVLPIATLMGASFPLVAQVLDDQSLDDGDRSGPRKWAAAYGANLSGAVLASLAAPYFVIPAVGIRGAMWICFGICAAVAAIVQFQGEPVRGGEPATELPSRDPYESSRPSESAGGKDVWLLLAAAFLSGWMFFALEVIWTHLIGAVIGGSVYAFSAMLASVLTGLLIGSAFAGRRHRMRTSVLMQLCAIALALQFWLWDIAPILFAVAGPSIYTHFFTREAYRLLVAALLIVPPAICLGMIYPRLLTSPLIPRGSNAHLAGYLSAWNSLGCLLGAVMATFILVPDFGSELSLKMLVMALGILGILFRLREPNAGASPRAVSFLVLAALAIATLPRHWEWRALTSGQSMYFGEARTPPAPQASTPQQSTSSIIFKDESLQGGFTTVVETTSNAHTVRYLLANGKLEGDDDPTAQVPTQFGVAAIPCLYAAHLDWALLIGLGTGHTAGILKELGVGQLDIAELSPGIVRAADADFQSVNFNVLHDPSVTYSLEDGRNLLLTNPKRRYDIITVEITSIWFAGATNVFSKEFFELARRRLQPDGALQQWVQLNRNSPTEIGSVIATARAVFPYVSYHAYGGQGMLIAANRPIVQTEERNEILVSRFSKRYGPEHARRLVDELSHSEILSEAGVEALIHGLNPVINTDHNRFIEYSTPARVSSERDWAAYNLAFFSQWNR